jgi:Zn-dependent protease
MSPEKKRVYTSFHDIPPREYMYFPKGSLETGKPGKFSGIEIRHLIISIIVMTIAFTFALTGNNLITGLSNGFNLNIIPYGLAVSFFGILTAFFFHEIAHKIMAQKHSLWSEYRMFPQGLILALFLGLLSPFVFAAPGAVMFMGGSRSHETGKIAMAGPFANIVVASVTLPIYRFVVFEIDIFKQLFAFVCLINAFLATFNLLPVEPLDGVKIIRWNPTVWIFLFIIAIIIFMYIITTMQGFSLNF